jgi:hypothetical protein
MEVLPTAPQPRRALATGRARGGLGRSRRSCRAPWYRSSPRQSSTAPDPVRSRRAGARPLRSAAELPRIGPAAAELVRTDVRTVAARVHGGGARGGETSRRGARPRQRARGWQLGFTTSRGGEGVHVAWDRGGRRACD